jgi:hypothetical protein
MYKREYTGKIKCCVICATVTENHKYFSAYRILVGKPEGKRLLGNQYVGGWITLKWILQ